MDLTAGLLTGRLGEHKVPGDQDGKREALEKQGKETGNLEWEGRGMGSCT